MHHSKAVSSGLGKAGFLAAATLALVALAPFSASASGVGSDNTMFKRHFWRGQAFHGRGYHPQISDIGRARARLSERETFEATVID